ncbi:MAG: class I SAM-dependent methyltransferase [Candidatus Aminicenantales bacterium]
MKQSGRAGFLGSVIRRVSGFLPLAAKNRLHRGLYEYLARRAEEHEDLHFWNFGYADADSNGKKLLLHESEEKHRYCLQLYDHIASAVDLRGQDVLEVGCGCGGGSSFLMKRHFPRSIRGIDQAENAIGFCNRHHSIPGLSYSCAQAESLPFENDSFDFVINLESSHCYGSPAQFFYEVQRVLRREGHFLFADFRRRDQMELLRGQLEGSGFQFFKEEIITPYVLQAMELDHQRKMNLLSSKAPKPLLNSLKYWWGTKDSKRYELFSSGEEIYFSYVLKKRNHAGLPPSG